MYTHTHKSVRVCVCVCVCVMLSNNLAPLGHSSRSYYSLTHCSLGSEWVSGGGVNERMKLYKLLYSVAHTQSLNCAVLC